MTEDDISQAIATIRKRKRILSEVEVMESLGITEDEINSANDPEIE
ncbi:MAG: hypothetical protein IKR28_07070 [Selenomonadaceae bacterium]|nr:hypothetical protein [Selenomonadaceae bacterium]